MSIFSAIKRVITDETRGDTIQPKLALINGLEMRKLAIKQFIALYSAKYPEVKKIDVELNEAFIPSMNKIESGDMGNEKGNPDNRL